MPLKKSSEYLARATPLGIKHDAEKLPLELLPTDALEEVARVLQFGAKKYGARNWEKGISFTRLLGALFRHAFAWLRGEDKDPETGLSHMAHAACETLFALAFELRGRTDLDDRPRFSPAPPVTPTPVEPEDYRNKTPEQKLAHALAKAREKYPEVVGCLVDGKPLLARVRGDALFAWYVRHDFELAQFLDGKVWPLDNSGREAEQQAVEAAGLKAPESFDDVPERERLAYVQAKTAETYPGSVATLETGGTIPTCYRAVDGRVVGWHIYSKYELHEWLNGECWTADVADVTRAKAAGLVVSEKPKRKGKPTPRFRRTRGV